MRAYVEEHGVGLTAPPADVARVAHAARELMRPEVNAALRKAVAAAARVTTWERERLVLERAYEDATAA
jgi:hypothetical protein